MIKQFLFMVCLILVTGSMLLIWDSPPESFLPKEANLVNKLPSADTYMTNIETFIFSSDGSKKYLLTASEMSLFSDQAEVKLIKPKFRALEIGIQRSEINITANQGLITKSSQAIQFMGEVEANWQAHKGTTALTAGTLIYSVKEDSASAVNGIKLMTPDSSIRGESFSADFQTELLKIESGVRATHDAI
jgi:LPS export ABC transporter protein LptC